MGDNDSSIHKNGEKIEYEQHDHNGDEKIASPNSYLSLLIQQQRMRNSGETMEENNSFVHNALIEWEEKDELKREVLQYLDVLSLVEKKVINKNWMKLCNNTINEKSINKKPFETNDELKIAVRKYVEYDGKKSDELTKLYGWPIGSWDISGLVNLSRVFYNVRNFNEDISGWDVSCAKNMSFMFFGALSFNQDISSWDVSNTTHMYSMFRGALSFNQDISSWDVSNTIDMCAMFKGTRVFNQDISTWNVSSVKNMAYMFYNATAFDYKDNIMSSWDLERENLNTNNMFSSNDKKREKLKKNEITK